MPTLPQNLLEIVGAKVREGCVGVVRGATLGSAGAWGMLLLEWPRWGRCAEIALQNQ